MRISLVLWGVKEFLEKFKEAAICDTCYEWAACVECHLSLIKNCCYQSETIQPFSTNWKTIIIIYCLHHGNLDQKLYVDYFPLDDWPYHLTLSFCKN